MQKIEDRKAKNRAAAQASRVKKRNEVDDLKRTVNTLKAENERLTAENGLLRQILFRYEVKVFLSMNSDYRDHKKKVHLQEKEWPLPEQ